MPIPRGFQFVQAPPDKAMRRASPQSAPRLFEWLVDEGYVTPVMQVRSAKKSGRIAGGNTFSGGKKASGKRPSAKASAAALASRGFRGGGGRVAGKKKKKKGDLF